MAVRDEQTARARMPEVELPALVSYVREHLGDRLTAVISGVADASVIRAWATGQARPEPAAERSLRAACQVTEMLLQADSAETARLWFSGMNTELDDEPPARMLASDPARVLSAARFFVAHG